MAEVTVDDRRVLDALRQLQQRSQNLSDPLRELGEYFIESTKQRFVDKQAPDGSEWPDNSSVTEALKGGNDPLIGETRRLSSEIHYAVSGDELEWGSSMEYAPMQHFGGSAEDFPNLWGDIPSREFLGVSGEDADVVLEVICEYLQGGI